MSDKHHRYYKRTKFRQNPRGDPKFLVDLTWNDPQARITERYMWQGVGKDVKAFVSTYLYSYTLGVYIYAEVYHAVDALQFRIAD